MMEEQKTVLEKGGSMRLGAYACTLRPGTKAAAIYGKELIHERHRHRFEFNNSYKERFEAAGMIVSGTNPDTGLAEIIESTANRWYIGVQFHPEYSSTVLRPHPLFIEFIKAAIKK